VTAVRRRLSWIAAAWLCCQLSLLTAAPLSMFGNALHASDSVTCTCVHTGNAECPMHRPARHDAKNKQCGCRSTTDPDAAAVLSLLGPIAILAQAPSASAPPQITRSPIHPITRFTGFIVSVDGPPPRA